MNKINLFVLLFTIFVPLHAMQSEDIVKALEDWQGEMLGQKITEVTKKHHFPIGNIECLEKEIIERIEKNNNAKLLFQTWVQMPQCLTDCDISIENLKKSISDTGIGQNVLLMVGQILRSIIKERHKAAQAYLEKEAKKLDDHIKSYVEQEEKQIKKKCYIPSAETLLDFEHINPQFLCATPQLPDMGKIGQWESLYGGDLYRKLCLNIKKEHGFAQDDRCFVNRLTKDILGCQLPSTPQWERFDCASRAIVAYLVLKWSKCINIAIKILTSEHFDMMVKKVNDVIEISREKRYGKDVEHGDWGSDDEVLILAGNLQEKDKYANKIVSIVLHPRSAHWIVFCGEYVPKYNMHMVFLFDSFSLGTAEKNIVKVGEEQMIFPESCFVQNRLMIYGDFLCEQIDGAIKRGELRGKK